MRKFRRFFVFDLCMKFKRLQWGTDAAEKMVEILTGRKT